MLGTRQHELGGVERRSGQDGTRQVEVALALVLPTPQRRTNGSAASAPAPPRGPGLNSMAHAR